jgi:hypothetical protein
MIQGLANEPISDETLMRFVDGDLSPDERSSVAAAIDRDPELAKRLEPFRFTRKELVEAYASALEIPEHLIEALLPAAGAISPRPNLFAVFFLRGPKLRHVFMATAAAVAFLLAGVSGWLLRGSLRLDQAGLIAPASMQRALNEAPSDSSTTLVEDISVKLISTFASLQKRWCREYVMLYANHVWSLGLACLGTDGIWRIEIQQDPAGPSVSPGKTRTYVPAGEGPEERGRQSVAEYRDHILRADVSLPDEADLIAKRWTRQP